jgi:hypothetical protein
MRAAGVVAAAVEAEPASQQRVWAWEHKRTERRRKQAEAVN